MSVITYIPEYISFSVMKNKYFINLFHQVGYYILSGLEEVYCDRLSLPAESAKSS